MTQKVTRRGMLAGALCSAATTVYANDLTTSFRPVARPVRFSGPRPVARPSIDDIIANAKLGGNVGFVAKDVATGRILASHQADVNLPPASVAKAVTSLYALDALGPAFRFETGIYASAPIVDGVLDGDIILSGSGDPQLVTDDLVALRSALVAQGLKEVRGRFLVWGGAIDRIAEIEPSQMDHLGYNPSVGGLNLNFNRVHFEWERQGTGYRVQMDARGRSDVPLVRVSQIEVVDRGAPVFAYRDGGGTDYWTVARSALNASGSRWLPVRYPALYTGDVFRALLEAEGIALPAPEVSPRPPTGNPIAKHQSAPLAEMLRRMLDKSTNLTAETAGLTATAARFQKRGLSESAARMSTWAQQFGADASFADHSGLSDTTRITANGMVDLLQAKGVQDRMYPILKDINFLDHKGRPMYDFPAELRAKTGTLNFVTSLAGYVRTAKGRNIAFAFFAADLPAREQSKSSQAELPRGASYYNNRAKALQQRLLQHLVRIADAEAG